MPASLQKVTGQRGNYRVKMYKEANSQTFNVMDFVNLAAKKVTLAVAYGSAFNSGTGKILGIVLRQGRNATNPGTTVLGVPGPVWDIQDTPVIIANDDLEFLLPLYDSSLATQAPYSAMYPGDTCALYVTAAGIWTADVSTIGTNPVIEMTAKLPGIMATDTYDAAWFKVISTSRVLP